MASPAFQAPPIFQPQIFQPPRMAALPRSQPRSNDVNVVSQTSGAEGSRPQSEESQPQAKRPRRQSKDVNVISRTSRAEGSRPQSEGSQPQARGPRSQNKDVDVVSRSSRIEGSWNSFLLITLSLGFSSWIISLVSQAVVAATISHDNAEVRILWFGIVIQFILLVEIFEVVISGNMFAYGIQISIFAGLATVFAVLGVDQNIYASPPARKGIGAGWLITAIVDLIWIIFFTSPPDSHFIRLASALGSYRPFSGYAHRSKAAEKVSINQDAFVMSPANGSSDAGPGAEALKGLGLDADEYATLAAVDIDKLKEERMRGPERTSGYDFEDVVPQRGSRTRSGGLWSNYTPSSQHDGGRATVSSGGTDGVHGAEREVSALSSEQETSVRPESRGASVSAPEAPSQYLKVPQTKASRMAPQPVAPAQPANEPIVQLRAEALFDYLGAADDPNELSFKKGEHLTIIDKSGKWWEAITKDGRKGIAPSNYLRLLI